LIILLYSAIGGFFGSISRFYIAQKVNKAPLGTWIANITGAALLGLLTKYFAPFGIVEASIYYLLMFGFCGAFTTFSTFGKETIELCIEKKYVQAAIYVTSSFLASFLIIFVIFAL